MGRYIKCMTFTFLSFTCSFLDGVPFALEEGVLTWVLYAEGL